MGKIFYKTKQTNKWVKYYIHEREREYYAEKGGNPFLPYMR